MTATRDRCRRLEAALDTATPGSQWAVTGARNWRVNRLTAALDLARRHGLPTGVEAAGVAQRFHAEQTPHAAA